MIEDRDEQLVEQFFADCKPHFEDKGFAHRVMRALPHEAYKKNRLWTLICSVVGVVMLIMGNVQTDIERIIGLIKGRCADIIYGIDLSSISLSAWLLAAFLLCVFAVNRVIEAERL